MVEIERFEDKLRIAVLELMKDINRNVHIEIDAEHNSKSVKIKLQLNNSFK